MKIDTILATKGMNVITIQPQRSLKEAVRLLERHNIGALVVVNESGMPVGIISERDIVHGAREMLRENEVLALAAIGLVIANRIGLGLPFIESWLAGKPDWAVRLSHQIPLNFLCEIERSFVATS